MTWTHIVGKKFSQEAFKEYVKGLHLENAEWKPSFVVLHNTSTPSLKQYYAFAKRGVTDERWLNNLAGFYRGKGWSAGPHLFIVPSGICAFTPLDHHGVHTPSWNMSSWGIEMAGDYEKEEFDSSVKEMAASALATLHHYGKLTPTPFVLAHHGLHFHKEDTRTTHKDCPGKNVHKDEMVKLIQEKMNDFEKTPQVSIEQQGPVATGQPVEPTENNHPTGKTLYTYEN